MTNSIDHSFQTLPNPFSFVNHEIRMLIDKCGEVWTCAKDACEALGIKNSRQAIALLDNDEKDGVISNDTTGRKQNIIYVSESGLYALIFNSRKPEAKKFRKWVTSEVLPTIRKQGFFGQIAPNTQLSCSKQIVVLTQKLPNTIDPFVRKVLVGELKRLYRMVGQPMPDINLILIAEERRTKILAMGNMR